MESRTRVLKALNHQEPDRVPFDLGSAMMTGIHTQSLSALAQLSGLARRDTTRIIRTIHANRASLRRFH